MGEREGDHLGDGKGGGGSEGLRVVPPGIGSRVELFSSI